VKFQTYMTSVLNSRLNEWLNTRRLPARLTVAQTAVLLGIQPHDVPVLVAARLLTPLGRPAANAPKFFAAFEIEQASRDRSWLDKASKQITQHWKTKNARSKLSIASEGPDWCESAETAR